MYRVNGQSWFLARRLLSTNPTMCFNFKEIQVSPKLGYFPLEFCHTHIFQTLKVHNGISIVETCYHHHHHHHHLFRSGNVAHTHTYTHTHNIQ